MKWLKQYRLGGVGFTVVLLLLIAASVTPVAEFFFLVMLVGVVGGVVGFHVMFPGSRFFSLAFANFIGIYTCIYIFLPKPISCRSARSRSMSGSSCRSQPS